MEVKNNIFNFLGSKENALENFTYDLYVLKSILLGEDEAWSIQKFYTPNIFYPMTPTTILELQSVGFERKES